MITSENFKKESTNLSEGDVAEMVNSVCLIRDKIDAVKKEIKGRDFVIEMRVKRRRTKNSFADLQ
jgi:hypothetical protein